MQSKINWFRQINCQFSFGFSLLLRIFYLFSTLFIFIFSGLAGCKQLSTLTVTGIDGSKITKQKNSPNLNLNTPLIERNNFSEQIKDNQTQKSKPIAKVSLETTPERLDPAFFLGQSSDQLADKLGQPSTLRKEGQIEIWQYQISECVIDFYFLNKQDKRSADYTEMRSLFLGGVVDRDTCMKNLHHLSQNIDISR